MLKKYQVFVSSTFVDLVDERNDTMKSILDLGHIPAGMEAFPALDVEQLKYIKKVIDECDYYILIIGARYGSVDAEGVSFTEREYRYAVESGKIVLGFVHSNASLLPQEKVDTDIRAIEQLNAFKKEVMSGRLVREWSSRDSLKYEVMKSLVAAFNEQPQTGWIRASAAASEDLLNQINTLRIDKEKLENKVQLLQEQNQPAINDIASLDSAFIVSYEDLRGNVKSNRNIDLSWREIFVAVGPELKQPRVPGVMKYSLEAYLRERRGTGVATISGAIMNTIKFQFIAHGLISNFTAKQVNGGAAEWVQLTDRGERVLMESVIVRQASV